jgi:transcription initiation factor TFIIIB Brf1 subunit/transcription initiation factor TFIIB
MALAASVIYLSAMNTGEHKTQRDIARAAGVSEFALRIRIQDLKNRLLLFPIRFSLSSVYSTR